MVKGPVSGADSLYLVGKVLGHRQACTTERYAHLKDDPLRAIANRTPARIAAIMKGNRAQVSLSQPFPQLRPLPDGLGTHLALPWRLRLAGGSEVAARLDMRRSPEVRWLRFGLGFGAGRVLARVWEEPFRLGCLGVRTPNRHHPLSASQYRSGK